MVFLRKNNHSCLFQRYLLIFVQIIYFKKVLYTQATVPLRELGTHATKKRQQLTAPPPDGTTYLPVSPLLRARERYPYTPGCINTTFSSWRGRGGRNICARIAGWSISGGSSSISIDGRRKKSVFCFSATRYFVAPEENLISYYFSVIFDNCRIFFPGFQIIIYIISWHKKCCLSR